MKKGFTLIELLIVILIIGILAAIALPQYRKSVEKAIMSEGVEISRAIASAHLSLAYRVPRYSSYYLYIEQANPIRIRCNEGSSTGTQKTLCQELDANGTL